MKRAVEWFKQLLRDLDEHDAIQGASAMAFHAFFSLVPLVALTGFAAHQLKQSSSTILGPITKLTPRSVAQLADSEFMRLSDSSSAVLPLSLVGFLWLSTDGIATAMRVFERIFGAEERRWWHCRLLGLGFVLGSIIVLSLSGAIALLAAYGGNVAARVAGVVAPIAALWLLVATFFRIATAQREGTLRSGFCGALVTLTAWLGVSVMFSYYVSELATYSRFYGSLATVVVLLLWLWLMSFALVIGGEVNARIEGVR